MVQTISYLSIIYAVLTHLIQGREFFIELLLGLCFAPGLGKKRWRWGGGRTVWDATFPCGRSLRPVPLDAAGAGKGGGMTKSFCLLFFCPGFAVATVRGRRGSELLEGQPRPCLEWAGQQTQKEGRVKNFLGDHLAPHCVPSESKGSVVTFGQLTTSLYLLPL